MAQDPAHSSRNQRDLQQPNQRTIHHHHHQQQEHLQHDDPDDEVSEEIVSLPYRKAYELAESFSATRIGQFVMNRGDALLKIIESTAKWSLPRAQLDDKLHRPLPWLPFLFLIISLRLARVWISIGALMIGNAPVGAQDVVYFIQTRRRKLRYLRLQGLKQINEKCLRRSSTGYRQSNLMSQLKLILSRAICSPGQQRQTESHKIFFVSNPQTAISPSDQQAAKRPRPDDDADINLSVQQMLERYANENVNADDDPDFVPDEHDTSATSSATSESNDEDEDATPTEHTVEMSENGDNTQTMSKTLNEVNKEPNTETETAYENGPANGDNENRTTDVALKFVKYQPFEHEHAVENLRKPESTQAMTFKQSALNAEAFNVALTSAVANLEANRNNLMCGDSSDVNLTNDSNDFVLTQLNALNVDSSPTLSASSSASSLESFIVNSPDNVNKDQEILTATTPTPSDKSDDRQLDEFATPSLTSISSSEDDFYSPIGSPTDFNALQQDSRDMPGSQGQTHIPKIVVKEHHSTNFDAFKRGKHQRGTNHGHNQTRAHGNGNGHAHGHDHGHGHGHGTSGSQNHQHQRYKERPTRPQHLEQIN